MSDSQQTPTPERAAQMRAIGKKGGAACLERHGRAHYAEAGRLGGEATARRKGRAFYQAIGAKGGARVRELMARGKEMEAAEQGAER